MPRRNSSVTFGSDANGVYPGVLIHSPTAIWTWFSARPNCSIRVIVAVAKSGANIRCSRGRTGGDGDAAVGICPRSKRIHSTACWRIRRAAQGASGWCVDCEQFQTLNLNFKLALMNRKLNETHRNDMHDAKRTLILSELANRKRDRRNWAVTVSAFVPAHVTDRLDREVKTDAGMIWGNYGLMVNLRHLRRTASNWKGSYQWPIGHRYKRPGDPGGPATAYNLEVEKLEEGLLFAGRFDLVLACKCVRCLKPFKYRLDLEEGAYHVRCGREDAAPVINDGVD